MRVVGQNLKIFSCLPVETTAECGEKMRHCCGVLDPLWYLLSSIQVIQLPGIGNPSNNILLNLMNSLINNRPDAVTEDEHCHNDETDLSVLHFSSSVVLEGVH